MVYQRLKRIMHMLVSVARNTLSASELSVAKIRADECVFLHSPPPVLGVPGVQFCFAIATKEWYLQTFLILTFKYFYYQLSDLYAHHRLNTIFSVDLTILATSISSFSL